MIFTIAEIGINHNGSLDIAKNLIRMAHLCGCNAVKFQKRDINSVYSQEFLDSPRNSPWGSTQREQKEGIELSEDEYTILKNFCSEMGIQFGSSCWDLISQDFINQLNPDFQKVASAMLTNIPLLENIAHRKIHTFISTGMSTKEEIKDAVDLFRDYRCSFELMHCVSIYPMKPELANLKRIETLRETFNCPVGYSGHEVGLSVSAAACSMGITSLERHITLDRSMYGSDQSASLELEGLRKLVKYSKEIERALGDGNLSLQEEELEVRDKLRK